MLVSFNWLKEYLDLSEVDPLDLADQLSLTGLEVEHIYQPGQEISGIVVGEIVEAYPIPDTHLHATKVNVGADFLQEIVCGAPNVAVGQKVIVAMPGAILPGGFKIVERKMQGHPSNGMICSLQELGFPEKVIPKAYAEGIYVFPDDIMLGQDAKDVLGLDDTIYELDLTPNRSDALSMRGVAHEVAAILSQKVEFPSFKPEEKSDRSIDEMMEVSVENSKDTPIYDIRVIENLKVKESPMWLQRKIMAAGMRPIDNLVDITNYMMMEYGQPLHAFDKDLISSQKIHVRKAEDQESIRTLDGKDRKLSSDDIVITDGDQPIAIGGVMGGENSHISDTTSHVVLEAAVFDPASIRRTAGKLNLRSEASARFEKGVNLATVRESLDHAAYLLADLGEGQVASGVAAVESKLVEDVSIELNLSYLIDTIGVDLTKLIIFDIFDRLGFSYEDGEGDSFTVSIPPRRRDIQIKADVAEEVARIYGYNNLPDSLPSTATSPGRLSPMQKLIRLTNRELQAGGLNQAINYSLTSKAKANQFALIESEDTDLAMPLSEDHASLRKSLIPGLLSSAQYNAARSKDSILLYEIGRVYHGTPEDQLLDEREYVAGLAMGNLIDDWTKEKLAIDYFSLKGILEALFSAYDLEEAFTFEAMTDKEGMHPGRTACILLGGQEIGFIGQVHPNKLVEYDLEEVYIFEFDLQAIHDTARSSKIVEDISKYPGVTRDVALLVNKRVSHKDIVASIEKAASPWLRSVQLFDYYEGSSIDDNKKSVAYSLFYQNPNATLLEDEVQEDFDRVVSNLVSEFNAEVR